MARRKDQRRRRAATEGIARRRIQVGAVDEERSRTTPIFDGAFEVITRRGLHPLEELVLQTLPELENERVLCGLGTEGIVAMALRLRYPECRILDFHFDAYSAARVRRNLAANAIEGVTVAVAADLSELEPGFQIIALPFSRSSESQLGREIMEQTRRLLAPGGHFFAATDASSDDWLRRTLKSCFGVQGTRLLRKRHKGFVWKVRNQKPTNAPPRDHSRSFDAEFHGRRLTLSTRPGVFSYGRVDPGSRALLELMRVAQDERVLDLGCGSGILGLFAARLAPEGYATLVDSSARAVALRGQNRRANDLSNARVLLRADVEDLEDERPFSLVLAYPPYFSRLRIAERFVERAAALLSARGRLILVAKAGARHRPLLEARFPFVTTCERRSYTVLIGHKTEQIPEIAEPAQGDPAT